MNKIKKQLYTKLPTTINQQISLLQNLGMTFDNKEESEQIFQHLAYYRLRAYWIIFEQKTNPILFKPNTNFNNVLNLYDFDEKLRNYIFQAITVIEISLRAQLSNLSNYFNDSHFYLNPQNFNNIIDYSKSILKLQSNLKSNNDELFIKHYFDKYSFPENPPIWSIVEIFTIGDLYYWLKNLKSNNLLDQIASEFGFYNREPFLSFLERINIIRNICAHHNRLWNRRFTKKQLKQIKNPKKFSNAFLAKNDSSETFYGTFIYLIYVLNKINNKIDFLQEFKKLISSYKIDTTLMGFPSNWENLELFDE